MGLLYAAVSTVAITAGLCVWLAWSNRKQKPTHAGAVKLVRFLSFLFFRAFDVAVLNLFQVCTSSILRSGPGVPRARGAHLARYMPWGTNAFPSAVVRLLLLQLGFSCGYTAPKPLFLRMELYPSISERPLGMHTWARAPWDLHETTQPGASWALHGQPSSAPEAQGTSPRPSVLARAPPQVPTSSAWKAQGGLCCEMLRPVLCDHTPSAERCMRSAQRLCCNARMAGPYE